MPFGSRKTATRFSTSARVELPLLESEEQARFGDWFQTRTGRPGGTPVAESNFVVAAFLLERQRHGDADLAQFTARLYERLEAMDVLEVFLVALAANRLGVLAPMKLFEGRRDAMTRFVAEGLCQLHTLPGDEAAVLWLHPQLANAVYQQLVGADAVERRGHDLARLFEGVIEDGPSARAFLSLLIKGKNPRLAEGVAEAALREIGRELAARQPPELRIGLTHQWQEGAAAHGIGVHEILNKERIRRWMASPELDAQGWGSLFQLCWPRLDLDEKEGFAREGLLWLAEYLGSGVWSFVWRLVWSLRRFDEDSIALARPWLDAHATEKGWGFVFQDLFRAGLRESWLREALVKGLRETPFSTADRYLWQEAEELGVSPEVLLPLVTRRLLHCSVEYVRREGILRVASLAGRIGWRPVLAVLRGSTEEPTAPSLQDRAEWNYVWQRLVELDPDSAELREIGRGWLGGREERAEWAFVWRRLAALEPQSSELRAIGRAWLGGREDRAEWSHVWRRLVDLDPDSAALREIGRVWLGGREERAEWNYVWQRLIEQKLNPDSTELRAIGRAWLRGREKRVEWPFVWRVLWRTPDRELEEQGLLWLSRSSSHPKAPSVRWALSTSPLGTDRA